MSNACYYHPNLGAVAVCSRCGRGTCGSCSKPYGALTLCPNCFYTVPATHPGAAPMPGPMAGPMVNAYPPINQPGWYGPFFRPNFFRSRWMPFILTIIAAALIFANGIALLSPAFFLLWIGLIPWVAFLGSFAFILGIMLGMILVGALVLMWLGFRVMSAFVIFPTAIVSLFVGGGFLLGAILAVIAGIILLL